MKYTPILFLTLIHLGVFAQEEDNMPRIKKDFTEWQDLLNTGTMSPQLYYNYVWGDNYEKELWTQKESDTLMLVQEVKVFSIAGLGNLVKIQTSAMSGDWAITSDNYYDSNGNLYFTFWTLKTFQAEVPLAVERRIYFNPDGSQIKSIQSVKELDTGVKSKLAFADQEVTLKMRYADFEFLKQH